MRLIKLFSLFLLLLCCSATASWAGVTFKNNGKSGSSFKGNDLKHLTATISLPKKLKDYKFDQVKVLLKLSHLDVDGIIYSDRAELPSAWGNSNSITVSMITPDGKSDFENNYGGSFGLKDFTTVPQQQKLTTMTATVQIKAYTKTGEKWQTYWDKMAKAYRSSSRPIYNAGTVITEGTMTVSLEKLTGFKDANGVISVEMPDDAWSGDTFTRKDLPGERRQFTEIRLTRTADEKIPVPTAVTAFAFDLNDWPELKDKAWAGLQSSVKSDFSNTRDDAQFGWNRIVTSEGIGRERAEQISSGVWQDTNVAGQPGLKAQFVEKETYSTKLYAPLYLTVRPPYVIAAWHSSKDGYYDKKMGKEVKLSPEQKLEITNALEQVIAKIKPLKGEQATGIWIPKADPPVVATAAKQKPETTVSETPFKPGDRILALESPNNWSPAKVRRVQGNNKNQYEYQVQFDSSNRIRWVKSNEVKAGSDASKPEEEQQKPSDKVKGMFKGFF